MLAPGALALPAGALAQQAQPGLGELARASGVTFGAAVQGGLLRQDADYAVAFAREAAIVVPEYEGKWGTLQPQEGRFNSAALDTILAWGRRAGRPVRGHALIWHQDMPDWTRQALAEGPDRAGAVMAAHIGTILEHTQPQIRDWDVVNEVVADPPGSDTPQASGELRDTPWLRALGPSYIETALKLAREADPTLRLTLNEYGIEEDTPAAAEKRRRLLALVRDLVGRKVPLDAVGLQAHLQLVKPFNPAVLSGFIKELQALGLAVLITEMDIREGGEVPQDIAARDALVAERAYAFVSTAVGAGVRTVLTWGLSDKYSWLATDPDVAMPDKRPHRGLPLDAEWKRKPMWDALARALTGR
ncbi:glycosyl hydrolase family 10 [Pseudoroseomonas wenyumeiae]|uniref:Beta-xylanase n=1 Tax=Teichococcus wenyumeiae TaxID=2478470 RepID=A0A3A9JFV8_9PROT|nr:endo-1,4-beta-xylanase [Pseudoroseomonas wenyumeiae]RKK05472.1 glycosyl hydrolase family 10 [Pseudoroseomonas wenyumeiae]RMI26406.1 glycosyl hydrolase family 10 [Pseudoroseomonas wenyumeiae]